MGDNVKNAKSNRISLRSLVEVALRNDQRIVDVMTTFGVSYDYCYQIKKTLERS
jgi:hypothetical protein